MDPYWARLKVVTYSSLCVPVHYSCHGMTASVTVTY